MRSQSDPDPEYGLREGVYYDRRELDTVVPDTETMLAKMQLQVGDVIYDAEEDIHHVVTNASCELLLDSVTASTYDELHEGGISTSLTEYYAKWRRGTLTERQHWPTWSEQVDQMRQAGGEASV